MVNIVLVLLLSAGTVVGKHMSMNWFKSSWIPSTHTFRLWIELRCTASFETSFVFEGVLSSEAILNTGIAADTYTCMPQQPAERNPSMQ